MNFVSFIIASVLLVTCVLGDGDHVPKVCVDPKHKNACENSEVNLTCVAAKPDSTCLNDVVNGDADIFLAAADEMVAKVDDLQIVYGHQVDGVDDPFIQYYGLAVVQKDTPFNFKTLKGKKSCHTGVGKTVGWKIPVGYLLYNKMMPYKNNQYESVSDFFAKSCAPGIKSIPNISEKVKTDLCSLCKGTCKKDNTEPYENYEGAFKCMAEGKKDRVGFVKQTTADSVLKNKTYGSKSDYQLLCHNGTKAGLDKYKDCNIGKRPSSAIVTGKNSSTELINKIQKLLEGTDLAKLQAAGIASEKAMLKKFTSTSVREYVGDYANFIQGLRGKQNPSPPSAGPRSPTASATSMFLFHQPVATILAFIFHVFITAQ